MAQPYVSFDEVKLRVTMSQILDHYGLSGSETRRSGDERIFHCFFHDDTTPSLKVNTVKNVFNCLGCNQGGDVIWFVVLKEGIDTGDETQDRREAALRIQEWFNLAPRRRTKARARRWSPAGAQQGAGKSPPDAGAKPAEPARERNAAPLVNPPLTFTLEHLDPTHPYLAERGLTPEAIAHFGLGFHAGRGMMHGRIVIPIHNRAGELVAYAGRWPYDAGWPEGEGKYKLPPNFHKSLELYNYHRAREYAHEGLIVVEGYFTVFDLWMRGRKNVVALMGSSLSEPQEGLLLETVGARGKVLLLFDNDPAGHAGMADAAARLVKHVFCRTMAI